MTLNELLAQCRQRYQAAGSPTMTMIEHAASAVWRASSETDESHISVDDAPALTRAALEAIREPNEAIKKAMFDQGQISLDAWRFTIDAILKEKP